MGGLLKQPRKIHHTGLSSTKKNADKGPSNITSTEQGMKLSGIAGLLIGIGVFLGAFGAHGLEGQVSPKRIETWETASFYHLFNALGLLLLSTKDFDRSLPRRLPWLILFGTVLFSGSLYLLVLLDLPMLGAITPFGGLAIGGGWCWLGIHLLSSTKDESPPPT